MNDEPRALAAAGRSGRLKDERLRGSVLDRFMRLAPRVDVLVVGTDDDDEAAT